MRFINPENPRWQAALAALPLADYALVILWRWMAGLALGLVLATGLALSVEWNSALWPGQRILLWLHALGAWLLVLHLLGHAVVWLRRVLRHPRSALAGVASATRLLWGLLGLAVLAQAISGFARFVTFHYGWELPFGLTALHARVAHSVAVPWLLMLMLMLGLRALLPVVRFLRQGTARR